MKFVPSKLHLRYPIVQSIENKINAVDLSGSDVRRLKSE